MSRNAEQGHRRAALERSGTRFQVIRFINRWSGSLRQLDQELKAARGGPAPAELRERIDLHALLGPGSFQQHTVATLRALCKENGIKVPSRIKKAELCSALDQHGVQPPPRPLESLSRPELITLARALMGYN